MSLKIDDVPTLNQSFADLPHRPVLVDLTVEEGQRLKVIYGSCAGFHAIDVDSGNNYDIYIPVHVSWILVGFDNIVFHFLIHRLALNNRLGILGKALIEAVLLACFALVKLSFLTDPEPGDATCNSVPSQLRRHGNALVLRG